MIAPSVHHVTLTVTDVQRSAEWYQRLLGAATVVERQGPTWERIRMEWASGLVIGVTRHEGMGAGLFDCTRPGLDHIGLACGDEAAVRLWHARLDELGYEHGPVESPTYGWAVTARDPDGIAIEFFSPASPARFGTRTHGSLSIRPIAEDHPRPNAPSEYDDWGELAPEAMATRHDRWLVELTAEDTTIAVGDMSAHAVWNGPTTGSRAYSIGISIVPEYRGRGIGSVAQRLLAEELHARGVGRVEASTDVTNIAEQRALQKAGFEFEGVLRRAQERRDGIHDLQLWSHVVDGPT